MNYFELLELPVRYDVDIATLESTYKTKQREFHPDRVVGKSDKEKLQAAQKSTDLNNAHNTLKDPLKRAAYLLKLEGIDVVGENSIATDPELLMESLEAREELSNASSMAEVKVILEKARKECELCERVLEDAFAIKDIDSAAQKTLRLKYLHKLLEETRLKQKELL